MKKLFFTLYWQHGRRQVISGTSIDIAFAAAGYGAGAVKAIDWYEEGVDESSYWDKSTKTWKAYGQSNTPASIAFQPEYDSVEKAMETNNEYRIHLDNGDIYCIQIDWGCYHPEGWVKTIRIAYLERHKGSYLDDGDEDEHFMVCNCEYFSPRDLQAACEYFKKRFFASPFKTAPDSPAMSIEEIAAIQHQNNEVYN